MSAGSITITATGNAGPELEPGEEYFPGPEGTYPVLLVRVGPVVTEPSNQPRKGPKDDGTWSFRHWFFAIDMPGQAMDGQIATIRANAKSTGERSKQFGIIAALVGRTPTVGATIDIEKHLVGRGALAYFERNDSGYLDLKTLMPAPTAPPAAASKAAAKPLAVVPANDDTSDDLPF